MIDYRTLPLGSTVFTHFDPETKEPMDLAIDLLLADKRVKRLGVIDVAIDREWAATCVRDRGIERHRLARLMDVKGEFDPIYYVHYGDGSKLQIEGVHRYVASYTMGRKSIRAKIIPLTVWKPYIISGLPRDTPEQLLNKFSGIL